MEKITDIQKEILKAFYSEQCSEDSGYFLDNDEFLPLMRYDVLVQETGMKLGILKVEVIELRNEGLLELCMAVDFDYVPSGSGYTQDYYRDWISSLWRLV